MYLDELLPINSIDDFRITLSQLFYGNDEGIFVLNDGKFLTIKLSEINTFDDVFKLGDDVYLTPKLKLNWNGVSTDDNDYRDIEIYQNNHTFLKNVKNKPRWVHKKNHNFRFMLENIFPENYLEHIFGKKYIVVV